MQKPLPKNITSYDFLKTFAVITMIIDHVGLYFFPEQLEWRLIGRMSMPVWLFLIGYANSRDIPDMLWIGAGVLVMGDIIVGMPVLSLNILFGIMLVRLTFDWVVKIMFSSNIFIMLGIILMVLAFFPTNAFIEYGTFCYLFAILGYAVRHGRFSENGMIVFVVAITLPYLLFENIIMGFNQTQFYVMAVLVTAVVWFLRYFKPMEFEAFSNKVPNLAAAAIKLMGRKTLEIYVIHLLVFKVIAFFIMADHYQFLSFRLF